jgi:hypothetical protein
MQVLALISTGLDRHGDWTAPDTNHRRGVVNFEKLLRRRKASGGA